ncbi:heptaprenyl diphosphate synthase [Sporolactobacillus sp. THM7-7]|nr:heptaprenyl diphosphate synthase [Sporolactobacillus sp. THM7-7]
MTIASIYRRQKDNLKEIETRLERALDVAHPILKEASLDLLRAGGKRIRPLLALVAAQYGDPKRKEVIDSAVSLELIHMASLVHDDVIDDSDIRRGRPTVKAKWDNRVAMYTGDFMFAKAIRILSAFENPDAHRIISKVIRDLSLGEIDQIRDLYDWRQNMRRYLLRIKRKTAILMALSCQLGALAAGCGFLLSRKLYYYGYFLGMSYQITDDILDFVGTEKQLGKPAGSDLRSGNITMPTYYALRNEALRGPIVQVLEAEAPSEEEWRQVIRLIKSSDAIEASKDMSERYLDKARTIVDGLPGSEATALLRQIVDYIGSRKY